VLLLGIGLALVLLIAVTAGFVWLVGAWAGEDMALPWIGEVRWLDDLLGWGSVVLMLVLSVFLMVPVASAITSMFLDPVAQAVEDVHYPTLPAATPVPFLDGLRDTVGFLGVMLLANIVALVLYLTPLAPFVFWGLNGFLLGREYFTLAAMRRVGRSNAIALRKRNFVTIWGAGILMAIPLSVPILNLVIPILGAATFTHLFHLLQARDPSARTSPDHER
jgi:uncharacterized protein involved in cysteine biosynthesis